MKIFIKLKFRKRIFFIFWLLVTSYVSHVWLCSSDKKELTLLWWKIKKDVETSRWLIKHSSFRNCKGFVLKWKYLKKNTELPTQIPSPENLQFISSRRMSFLTYFRYCGLCIPRVCSRTPFETSPLCQVQNIHKYYDHSLLFVKISILFRYSGRGPWKIQEVRSPHLQILAGSLTISTVFIMFRPASHPLFKLLRLSDSCMDNNVFLHFETCWIVRKYISFPDNS